MDGLLGPRRRQTPQAEPAEAASRVATRRHLDARLDRLRAYAATLEAAAAARPSDVRLVGLERQLAQARRDMRAAHRPRLQTPEARPLSRVAAGPAAPSPSQAARPLPVQEPEAS